MQMLVYEYVPNGSVSTHLHGDFSLCFPNTVTVFNKSIIGANIIFFWCPTGSSHAPGVKLEFKQRLSIAHGAAKGQSLHVHQL